MFTLQDWDALISHSVSRRKSMCVSLRLSQRASCTVLWLLSPIPSRCALSADRLALCAGASRFSLHPRQSPSITELSKQPRRGFGSNEGLGSEYISGLKRAKRGVCHTVWEYIQVSRVWSLTRCWSTTSFQPAWHWDVDAEGCSASYHTASVDFSRASGRRSSSERSVGLWACGRNHK